MSIALFLVFGMIVSSLHQNAIASAAKTKIALNKTEVTLSVKKSTALKLKKATKGKLKKKITWKSSNKSVATVTKQGRITGRKPGTAKITVKGILKNGKKISTVCKVTVKQQKKSVAQKPTATNSSKETEPSVKPIPTASVIPAMPTVTKKPIVLSSKAIPGTLGMSVDGFDDMVVRWYKAIRSDDGGKQIVSTYAELQKIISEAKPTYVVTGDGIEGSQFADALRSYKEDYFEDKALCIGDFELTYGYKVSLDGITKEKLSDHTSRINMSITKKWIIPEDCAAFCVMVPYLVIVEVNKEDVADCSSVVCNISK